MERLLGVRDCAKVSEANGAFPITLAGVERRAERLGGGRESGRDWSRSGGRGGGECRGGGRGLRLSRRGRCCVRCRAGRRRRRGGGGEGRGLRGRARRGVPRPLTAAQGRAKRGRRPDFPGAGCHAAKKQEFVEVLIDGRVVASGQILLDFVDSEPLCRPNVNPLARELRDRVLLEQPLCFVSRHAARVFAEGAESTRVRVTRASKPPATSPTDGSWGSATPPI